MYSVDRTGGTAVISIDSSIEKGAKTDFDLLKEQCLKLREEGILSIILEMSRIENASSLILGTVILIQKKLEPLNGKIAIAAPTEKLRRILEITGMNKIIRVYDSKEKALNVLDRRAKPQPVH